MSGIRNLVLVARRELVERGRSAYFLVSTVIMLLVLGAMIAIPALLHDESAARLGVVEGVSAAITEELGRQDQVPVELVGFADPATAEAALADGEVAAVLTRRDDGTHEIVWQSDPDPPLAAAILGAVSTVEHGERAARLGIDPDTAAELLAPPAVDHRSLVPPDPEHEGRFFIAMIALILLFMAIVTYCTFVLTGVAEEKSSRVVEILLARIPPRHLLAGKIAGIGALGLAQLVLFVAAGLIALRLAPALPGPLPTVSVGMVVWLVVWFVLGYAFYATAYGAVGALATQTEDAQNAAGPLVLLLMGAYLFVFLVAIDDPDSLASRIGSLVPVTAPFVMPVRIALGEVTAVESIAGIVIMLAAIYGLVHAAGRIYEGAILRAGARVKLRDAWRTAA